MRVFVTGASGYVGSGVVAELIGAGHYVTGLARSDASAAAIEAAGADVLRGTLTDLDSLRSGAQAADGVIHLAYVHDFAAIESAGQVDFQAVQTLLSALEGTGKPFVGTSGTLIVAGLGRVGTEADTGPDGARRVDSENLAVSMAARGVRSSVVRLAPTVHGDTDKHGFIPSLITMARDNGSAAYVADGSNRWPAVHLRDAARLFRLAVESAPAGTRLHGNGEQGVPFRLIAEAIGRQLGVPVRSVSPDEAPQYLGFLAQFAAMDDPTSSEMTQQLLDWKPTEVGIIADLDAGHYFQEPAG